MNDLRSPGSLRDGNRTRRGSAKNIKAGAKENMPRQHQVECLLLYLKMWVVLSVVMNKDE